MKNLKLQRLKKGTIVAIGGGEIGRKKIMPDGSVKLFPIETLKIDKEIIKLSGKKHPKLLFLGTASGDAESYIDVIQEHFGKRLGCDIDFLNLVREKVAKDVIRKKIFGADIIYVGGGDTKKMLDLWRKRGIDLLLKEALDGGCVLSGTSAGAICWFEWYDSLDYVNRTNKLRLLKGLGFLKGAAIPHYNTLSPEHKNGISQLIQNKNIKGYGIDECCALVFGSRASYVVSSKPKAGAFLISV